nr:hypothetical protein [Tanacetum cinerariifolium]
LVDVLRGGGGVGIDCEVWKCKEEDGYVSEVIKMGDGTGWGKKPRKVEGMDLGANLFGEMIMSLFLSYRAFNGELSAGFGYTFVMILYLFFTFNAIVIDLLDKL